MAAIAKIERYTRGMDLASFCASDVTVDAVVHNFVVIGEAARQIPKEVEAAHGGIPWESMRGMRNIVVHQYFGVSLPILWETTHKDLPPLVPLLEKVLAS